MLCSTCSRSRFGLLGAIMFAAILLPVGCGQKASSTGTVTGTVTYKGKPVTEGNVNLFMAQRGIGYGAQLGADGTFTVSTPLEVGTYTVTVLPPVGDPDVREKTRKTPRIPLRAQDERSSGLSVTVVEGNNTVALELLD